MTKLRLCQFQLLWLNLNTQIISSSEVVLKSITQKWKFTLCFRKDQGDNDAFRFCFRISFFLFISHQLKKVTRLWLILYQLVYEQKKQTSNPLCLSRHCFAKRSDSAFLCYFLSFPVMVGVFQRVELTLHIGRKMHITYQLDTLSASVGGKAGGKTPWHRLIKWDFFKRCGDAVAANAMHDWYIEQKCLDC